MQHSGNRAITELMAPNDLALSVGNSKSHMMVTVNQTVLAGGTEQGANSVQSHFITAQTAICKLIVSPNHSMAQEK